MNTLNSYVTRNGPQPADRYPRLMEAHHRGFIVLFHAANCGTVVASDLSIYSVGQYSTGWAMEAFREFHGSVTIGDTASVSGSSTAAEAPTSEYPQPVFANGEPAWPTFFEDKTQPDFNFNIDLLGGGDNGIPCGTPGCCENNPLPDAAGNSSNQDEDAIASQIREGIASVFRSAGFNVEVVRVG